MQPEPAKYAHGPSLDAKTFMQPEHSYFSHHPGRFFYIKDKDTNSLFSVPFAPVKADVEHYKFIVASQSISWRIEQDGLVIELKLSLDQDKPLEVWDFSITNSSDRARNVDVYPYFPIGYMSWMNQSADYDDDINGIVASSVTPYQKVEEYYKNQQLKDLTFFLSKKKPTTWTCEQADFEGHGGLHCPDGVVNERLNNNKASYQIPAACMQFSLSLLPNELNSQQFLFGAANHRDDIDEIHGQYFSTESIENNSN
jgi:cellobionic acid phosphorylase